RRPAPQQGAPDRLRPRLPAQDRRPGEDLSRRTSPCRPHLLRDAPGPCAQRVRDVQRVVRGARAGVAKLAVRPWSSGPRPRRVPRVGAVSPRPPAARASRAIGLITDVPVGFASDGYAAWRWREYTAPGM